MMRMNRNLLTNLFYMKPPKYRVRTTQAVKKDVIASVFKEAFPNNVLFTDNHWLCNDGSVFIFFHSSIPEYFFVELQCQFHASDNQVNYGLLPIFINFCAHHGGEVYLLRKSTRVHASPATINSDVLCSHAGKIALHMAKHPKDFKK